MNIASQKLIDQMGFTDREIARRLHLLNFTEHDYSCIKQAGSVIDKALPNLVKAFYEFQLEDPEVSVVIGDIDTLIKLKGYMKSYIQSLFQGDYGKDYVNSRLRIGKVHKRLEVHPRLYMKAHAKLQSLLESEIDASCDGEKVAEIKSSLQKILLFDAELIFDAYVESYLSEMQAVTREVEMYAVDAGIKMGNMFSRLHELNQKDSLTGLYNRHALYDFLKNECRVAERHHLSFVLVYMDLNNFKPVNDTHGHHEGDEVLVQVAESMMAVTRAVDIPVRYGGDEFCILMPRTSLEDIELPLKRLTDHFDKLCPYPVTFSMGVVQVGPTHFCQADALIDKADTLMYQAKHLAHQDGKHHWKFSNEN